MSAPIVVTTEVGRPAEEVFGYATDPSRFHEWQQGVVGGHLEADRPTARARVGDTCVTVRHLGFADRPVPSRITVLEPPRRWVVEGTEGPIRARVQVDVEALAAERSRLTIAIAFHGHGIGRLIVPLAVVPGARREMPANLAELRRRLEAGAW